MKSPVPLPPELLRLPAIKAEPWVCVEDNPGTFLEGPAFDREGNLFVSSIFDNRLLKITPKKKVSTVLQQPGLLPDGIAIHKDGRLFIACLSGKLMTVLPNGTRLTEIEPKFNGRPASLNDLVFDRHGNLYVTDFTGTLADPTGASIGTPRTSHGLIRFFSILRPPTASASPPRGMPFGSARRAAMRCCASNCWRTGSASTPSQV